MSLTLNVYTKVITGRNILHQDAASPIGSGLISLAQRSFVTNLTLAEIFQTQRVVPKLWHD